MKLVKFNDDAQKSIEAGVNKIADAVGSTLGPKGRVVIISKMGGAPTVTKDGVTVAKEFDLEDVFENAGAKMVKEVASKVCEIAGDGTTTSTVLSRAFYLAGRKAVVNGANPVSVKNGMHVAVQAIVEDLKKRTRNISTQSEVAQVASIAANNDKVIGHYIADAMSRVGNDGVVTVDESRSTETSVELIAGMKFERGWHSSYFVNVKEGKKWEAEKAAIFITDSKKILLSDFITKNNSGLLPQAMASNTPLLIIAPELPQVLVDTLILNHMKGIFNVCFVKAPLYGEEQKAYLEDLAVSTGGFVYSDGMGKNLSQIPINELGVCDKVIVTKDSTTLLKGHGQLKNVEAKMDEIRNMLETEHSEYAREKLQERLSRLSGGVAKINVGAPTEVEMKEKKARVEDALHATRAALEKGVLPGGGVAILRSRDVISKIPQPSDPSERIGLQIVYDGVEDPIRTIIKNAGKSPELIINKILENDNYNFGYDAANDTYKDLDEAGIIDPTKVTIAALDTAASIAGLLLTSQAMLVEPRPKGAQMDPADALNQLF